MSKVKIIYEMKNFISHTATSYISKLQTYCIYCNSYRNEWFGVKGFIYRRGRCFYCRVDRLDRLYGPSMTAKMVKQLRKHYISPLPNHRETKRLYRHINRRTRKGIYRWWVSC